MMCVKMLKGLLCRYKGWNITHKYLVLSNLVVPTLDNSKSSQRTIKLNVITPLSLTVTIKFVRGTY